MNTTIVTIVGTLVMLDYCSTSKKDEDGDYNFNEFYYQTAGFLDFEDGGLFVNDDQETDLIKKKGKYIKTKEHFTKLFAADGEHPLPVELHWRCYYANNVSYRIDHEGDFDIKKLQLVKSDYELQEFPYLIIADYVMYDGQKFECDELIKARMGMMRKKVTAAQRIDAIEERLIYGSISKEKAAQLEEKVKQEIRTHETTISEIDEKMRKTDILIEQCDRADTIDYDTFDTAQKINLVRQTIEKIIISKPDRNHARTEVTPKVGTFTYIFEMDVYRKTTTMTSKMQK